MIEVSLLRVLKKVKGLFKKKKKKSNANFNLSIKAQDPIYIFSSHVMLKHIFYLKIKNYYNYLFFYILSLGITILLYYVLMKIRI